MNRKKILCFALLIVMMLSLFTGCKGMGRMVRTSIRTDDDGAHMDTISRTAATTADGVSYYEENRLKVVSYNIRCANDPDGNSIAARASRLVTVLEQYDADLMGFQEFVPSFEKPLDQGLADEYDYVIHYRSRKNHEGTSIFWKKDKFELLDSGYFWLSETPGEESKGWGAEYWRICSWVMLKVRQTGEVFYYFNTHVDFNEKPQVESAKMLIEKAVGMCNNQPMIVTGDFNMKQDSKGYAQMTTRFTDVNMATAQDKTGTYTDYGKCSELIDYCFVTGGIKPAAYRVMTDQVDGKFVSDHYGVYSEIIIL